MDFKFLHLFGTYNFKNFGGKTFASKIIPLLNIFYFGIALQQNVAFIMFFFNFASKRSLTSDGQK